MQKIVVSEASTNIIAPIDIQEDGLSHLVCFISTANGHSKPKKKRKEEPYLRRLALVAGT
jgi:hypothetical protein